MAQSSRVSRLEDRCIALAQFPDDRARSLANQAEVFLRRDGSAL